MTDVRESPPEKRTGWLVFDGDLVSLEPGKKIAVLSPKKDPLLHLTISTTDVRLPKKDASNQDIFIRLGSKLLSINALKDSAYESWPFGEGTPRCSNGSMCLGNIEFCCGTNECVGSCNGYWRCP